MKVNLLKLVIIIGSEAVGKMTIGQKLMDRTGLRLFHNHMIIEPVIDVFGYFNGKIIQDIRHIIFQEFVKTDLKGMIFTFMWAFEMQSDWDYITELAEFFKNHGSEIYWIELVADQSVRLERNKSENRLANKKSKRDLKESESRLLGEETNHRLVSFEGEIQFENYIKIDNTFLTPDEVVDIIQEKFKI